MRAIGAAQLKAERRDYVHRMQRRCAHHDRETLSRVLAEVSDGAEWYPARGHELAPEDAAMCERMIFYVRPVELEYVPVDCLARYRSLGCNSTAFCILAGRPSHIGAQCFACEHEIVIE